MWRYCYRNLFDPPCCTSSYHHVASRRFTISVDNLPIEWYPNRLQEQSSVLVCVGGSVNSDAAARYHLLRVSAILQQFVLRHQPETNDLRIVINLNFRKATDNFRIQTKCQIATAITRSSLNASPVLDSRKYHVHQFSQEMIHILSFQ
jgi:hypothetical protein